MRSLYIDPVTYDLVVENRNLKFTSNISEWLSAKLEAKLTTFLGEWFANNEIGVPYYQEILKKQVDLDNVQAIFSDIIRETNGVEELLSFAVTYDNVLRKYTYSFSVRGNEGSIIEGGSSTL